MQSGYTTTCGTEGNLLGILYGREKLEDGQLYYSADSHYSVPKAGKLYRIPLVPVKSQLTGEMDYAHLRTQLAANRDKPAIISINVGTTVKGAVDSLHEVLDALRETGFTACVLSVLGFSTAFRNIQ
jgi:histidine decarboxylase